MNRIHPRLLLIRAITLTGLLCMAQSSRAGGPVTSWGRGGVFCGYCDSGQTGVPGDLTNAVAVAGGWNHSLALRDDGTVAAWGESYLGATSVPSGLSNVTAIAAGDNDSMALLSNGTVVAWGYNGYGQTNVPANLSNVVAIACGNFFNLALRADGSVAAWGDNGNSQVLEANYASGIKAIAACSANTSYALGLTTGGTVVEWGGFDPPMPANLTNVIAIAVGDAHYLALRGNGTVAAWGDDSSGQTSVPTGLSNVVAIVAGRLYSVALKSDGTLVAWGTSNYGLNVAPLGLTNVVAVSGGGEHVLVIHDGAPCLLQWPTSQSVYTGMSASFPAAAARTASGPSYQWQFGGTNIIGANANSFAITNARLADSGTYTLVLSNSYGTFSSSAVLTVSTSAPVIVQQPADQIVAATSNATFTVSAVGSLPLSFQWQCNSTNIPGQTNTTLTWPAAPMNHSGFTFAVVVTNAHGVTVSSNAQLTVRPALVTVQPGNITTNGGSTVSFTPTVTGQGPFSYQWLFNETNLPNATNIVLTLNNALVVQSGTYAIVVSNGFGTITSSNASLTVLPWIGISVSPTTINSGAGTLVIFSFNVGGLSPVSYQWTQNGNPIGGPAPGGSMQIIDPPMSWAGVYNVSANDATTSLTSSNVSLTIVPLTITSAPQSRGAWPGGPAQFKMTAIGAKPFGYQWRLYGTNLPGATTNFLAITNVQVSQFGPYDVVLTNAYTNITSTVATLGPSEVAVWGYGASGETNLPLGLTNVMAVSGGGSGTFDSMALKRDGTVQWWPNANNLLVSNLVAIAGAGPGIGLKTNGTVVAWYADTPSAVAGLTNIVAITSYHYGYLGLKSNGTVVGTASAAGISNAVAIAEGNSHSLALKANGTVTAWGNNAYGQTNVPSGLSNVVAIAAGLYHNLALRSDGKVVAWGRYTEGQTNVPTTLSNVVAIAAGGYHSMALKSDGTMLAWGLGNYGQTNVPPGLSNVVAIAAAQYHSLALIGSGPPVVRPALTNPAATTGLFNVSVPSQSGKVYSLEYKNDPADANWIPLPLFAGNGDILLLTDPSATNSQRIYRVSAW